MGVKKAGHGGTLDLAATGLLVVGTGYCTRFLEYVLGQPKEYIAEITFGISSDTLDLDGNIIERVVSTPDFAKIAGVLNKFYGEIEQIPPVFSALKSGGKPLYKLAREGKRFDIESKKRKITIYYTEILSYEPSENSKLTLKIGCSSGTYIRSIARDIGLELNTPSLLSSLVRTKIGKFSIEDAIYADEVETKHLIYPPDFLKKLGFYEVVLEEKELKRFTNGNFICVKKPRFDRVIVLDREGGFYGVGYIDNEGILKPSKVCRAGGSY
jgi:tRNA pseudouridine55 synthase